MYLLQKPGHISEREVEHVLKTPPTRWDKQIAADIIAEMEIHLAESVNSIADMRVVLAVAGYRGLHQRILGAIEGKTGEDAIRAMAFAMRSYALGSPGLAAASFRNPQIDSQEWQEAGRELAATIFRVFGEFGLQDEMVHHAVRILRSLVRGFILNEMASNSSQPIDFQKSYVLGVDVFISGLRVLRDSESHVLDC
ncbi:hypothetical protein BH10PSE11_BH10PSE11_10030 [soil metagenome]